MTVKIALPAGTWTEVVASTTANFLIDNPSRYYVDLHIGATIPGAEAAYHKLLDGDGFIRVTEGKVWARPSESDVSTFVIVTT